jgi:tetratricopeptide (TPR) repeat protein
MHPTAPSGIVLALDGFARLALIVFAALLPIFVIPAPWASIAQSKMLLLAVVVIIVAILWAIARLIEGTIHVPRSALIYAVALLPVAYAVSVAATGLNGSGIVGQGIEQDTLAAVAIWYALFALFAMLFAGHMAGLRSVIRGLCIGLTAVFALRLLYTFFPSIFGLNVLQGATANVLGSWHDLGILAALGLFLSIALFRSGVFSGAWRALCITLGILAAFVLLLVHFTDMLWGATALLAGTGLVLLRLSVQAHGHSFMQAVKQSIVPFALAVFLGLAAAFGTPLWDKLPEPIRITEIEVRPSWQGTLDVGRQSLGAPQSLLFGTGPNSFVREWGEHKPAGVNVTPFWNADFNFGVGIIPTSVFTAGVVGTLAWLVIAFVLLGLVWRFVREVRPLTPGRTLFGVLLASAVYLLVFHMIYTPGAALTAIMFLILALLTVIVAGDRPARAISTASMTNAVVFAVLILLAVPAVFAAGTVGREIASNLYVNRAAASFQANADAGVSGGLLGTALTISPRNDRAHRAASELGLVELGQLMAQGDPQTDEARAKLQETLQSTIQHGLTAVEIDDANYQNWLVLAQVYGSLAGANVDGAYEQAKSTYERASQTNPTNPVPKLRLAQLAAARNDMDGARTYLQEALALKQDFAAAYYLLSQVEAASGNGDPAMQAAAAAVQLVPNDPLGWFNLGLILHNGGIYQDASLAFEQAISRANDYSNAYFYLGAAYYELGRSSDAVLAFQRVLQLNPAETWINQVIANIQSGAEPFAGVSQIGQ